jgi:riboflavin synthase
MFTGIIETLGTVVSTQTEGTNLHLTISSPITGELRVDQSVAHNGVCLTVTHIDGPHYRVTAVAETLAKTNLGLLRPGDLVNLERSLRVGDRLDGHFVQGHVDATGTCVEHTELDGSWLFRFTYPDSFSKLVIEKGSICINGVSLTAFAATSGEFTVTIIPYTHAHTNFSQIQTGTVVNLEFDVLGKYILGAMGQP